MSWLASSLRRCRGSAAWRRGIPPLAAAIGILTAGGLRWWPLVLALELFGGWIVAGLDAGAIAVYAVPTVIEALLAAGLLRRLVLRFERGEDAIVLAGVSLAVALTGATLAAAVGAVVQAGPVNGIGLWACWWMSDAATMTTLLPLVLLVVNRAHGTLSVPRRAIAATEIPAIFAASVGLVVGSAVLFAMAPGSSGIFTALWVVPIAWMAVRYERLMAGLVVAVTAATAFFAFTSPGMPTEALEVVSLQATLVATGLIGVLVSASIAGRRRAFARLEHEEERLRRSEALLADAAAIGGVGSWESEPGSGSAIWSEELYRIAGLPQGAPVDAETLPGLLAPADADRLRASLASATSTGPLTVQLTSPSAVPRTLVVAWRQVADGTAPHRRVVGVVRDVTEERALQSQLQQAQRVESIGMLAGGVAHDFNNLLTAIAGFADFARLSADEGRSPADDLEQVQATVARARSLTDQLLAYSRRAVVSPRDVDLGDVVDAVAPMLRRLLGEHVEIIVTHREPATVRIDPGQLDQVLVNLAVNARDAMPGGGRLQISTGRVAVGGVDRARMEVQDDGTGIEPAVLDQIFMPFYTTKGRGEGTGLGLSTVFGIVTQAGGTIEATSRVGEGTTFRVDLPAVDAAALERRPAVVAASPTGRGRVLYVEDEDGVRMVGMRALSRAGFRVVAAATAAEARALAGDERPDILVTDIVLPGGVDGISFADEMRARWPSLPVLLVSGYSERTPPPWAPLLPKPFTIDQLVHAVTRQLLGADADASPAHRE
ncbi:MAG: ATP-binding protein [Chloroflexota bacterium]